MKYQSLKLIALLLFIIFYSCEPEVIFEDTTDVEELENSTENIPVFDDLIVIGPGGGGNTGGNSNNSSTLSDRFQYFHRGNSSKSLFSSSSTTGTGSWSSSRNPRIGEMKEGAISAAQFGNRLVVAHRGNNSSTKVFYATSSNGSNFSASREINSGARTKGAFRIIEFNNRLYMYHTGFTGSNTNRIFYNFSSNLINWGGNSRINDNGNQLGNFDVIANNGRMYLVGGRAVGNRIVVQSSTDGVNFQDVSSTPLTGFDRPTVSVTKIGSTFYLLIGRRVGNGELDLYIAQSTNNFRTISTPRPIRINGSTARSDALPSLAASNNRLVVAFEENRGRRIFFAYSDNRGLSWAGNRNATGETRNSAVELIYTREP